MAKKKRRKRRGEERGQNEEELGKKFDDLKKSMYVWKDEWELH